MKDISVKYDSQINGIIANIIGEINSDDINIFKTLITETIQQYIPDNKFTLLLNGNGYLPDCLSVHAEYSNFLKNAELITKNCIAVAHVHHSRKHIDECMPLSSDSQGFFADFEEAYNWLKERLKHK
jgi:hypothetical protein